MFSIKLHKKDIDLLKEINAFFGGIGSINIINKNEAIYSVSSKKGVEVLINHFDNYPLFTQKYCDFKLFKQAFSLIKGKEHLTLPGISKLACIKASMNNNTIVKELSGITPVERPVIPADHYNKIDQNWISGFTSADGSFYAGIKNSLTGKDIGTVFTRFILSQDKRDEALLLHLSKFLSCGKVYKTQNRDVYNFVVSDLYFIKNIIIPLLDKHPILGVKALDYQDFKRIVYLVDQNLQKTPKGFNQIKEIKNGMNTGRKDD